jgi:hypothetical protein
VHENVSRANPCEIVDFIRPMIFTPWTLHKTSILHAFQLPQDMELAPFTEWLMTRVEGSKKIYNIHHLALWAYDNRLNKGWYGT